jgi:hypothetical protein
MIVEGWRTRDGYASVEIEYDERAAEKNPPVTVLITRGWQTIELKLAVEDYKNLLKAGMRLDERIPRPSEWIGTLPEVKTSAPKRAKGGNMAKKQITTLVCDGCGADITEGEVGSAKARIEVVGEDFIRNVDFCPECVSGKRTEEDGTVTELHAGLPTGTTRKRRTDAGAATAAPEGEVAIADLTVAQLDERYGTAEGYPTNGNKAEKVAFAEAK